MKRIFLSVVLATFAQLCSAATCVDGTLSSYIGLGATGCTIGSSTLSGFQVLPGTTGPSEILASSVFLSPLGDPFNPGLTTSVSVTSQAGTVNESLFTYQISGASYLSSTITLSNASETPDGAVTGLENFCAGGAFGADGISGCTGIPGALATVDGALNQDSSPFTSSGLVSVTNDLTIDGGLSGSATGATLVDQFGTPAPEPATLLLLALGLASFVAVRRLKFASTLHCQEIREQSHE